MKSSTINNIQIKGDRVGLSKFVNNAVQIVQTIDTYDNQYTVLKWHVDDLWNSFLYQLHFCQKQKKHYTIYYNKQEKNYYKYKHILKCD